MIEDIESAIALLQKHGLKITGLRCTPEVKARMENESLLIVGEIQSGRKDLSPYDGGLARGIGSRWGEMVAGIPLEVRP